MLQVSGEISVRTPGRALVDVTRQIDDWLQSQNLSEGVLTLFIQHTSASLTIQENADPDVLVDLLGYFERQVIDGDPAFYHRAEGPDDMSAHIRSSLTDVSLTIPVLNGRMRLGTWQGIYVFEHRTSPHHRRLALNFIGS
ncbi:secondary thiamine-phosphate synthase enzyme YjbQ [Sneathiella limimaris]|uniref:secondary thiamine-phosphate synthase enzyme YjbQ n=1 Tax=Sneathiella limimaris TaxID=1964213 RepID=UPI00146CB5EB|nr:secondary thiamine-phosphate synthase enzyme YjbQ [Sneathiella limimaris]